MNRDLAVVSGSKPSPEALYRNYAIIVVEMFETMAILENKVGKCQGDRP